VVKQPKIERMEDKVSQAAMGYRSRGENPSFNINHDWKVKLLESDLGFVVC
jgi:hypothetical protein